MMLEVLVLFGVLTNDLGLGVQSEARALNGEQGEVMLSGEAGLGGEGFARSITGFSSTGEVGRDDLDVEGFFSL